MKVSVDQRRLKARQMLVEASWAKSALIKALKDDDPVAAKKALNDLVSAQGYASSPAQELGLNDKDFSQLSAAISDQPIPGISGTDRKMDYAREILGVGKTDKPQQKYVPGHVQKAQQKGRTLTPEEENIFHRYYRNNVTLDRLKYDQLKYLYEELAQDLDPNETGPEQKAIESVWNKVYQQAKKHPQFKDSDFPDI